MGEGWKNSEVVFEESMSFFNQIYSWNSQMVMEQSKVTIRPADTSFTARAGRWLRWMVLLPIEIPHKLHTLALMIKNQEMIVPLQRQIAPGRSIHKMATFMGNQHVVTSSRVANEILRHYRSQEGGLFSVDKTSDNSRLFLPLLKDLMGESVNEEDFLLTCHAQQAESYRKVILEFFGPKNMTFLKEELGKVIKGCLNDLQAQEIDGVVHLSTRELAGEFTVAVISRLLLGKELARFEDYRPISQAITCCIEYAMMKFVWKAPTREQEANYQKSLQVMRDLINHSAGRFSNALQEQNMTDVQRKGILFLMYIGGNETTSSLLEYMLWQLGRLPGHQDEILNDRSLSVLNRFLHESLRMHTPAALIGRYPQMDLEIHVENPGIFSWSYLLPQGENLLISPYFIARDPTQYPEPDIFNPNRKQSMDFTFGKGKHGCVGKWLALSEVQAFTDALLEHYQITSSPEQMPRQQALLTLTFKQETHLTLTRRHQKVE